MNGEVISVNCSPTHSLIKPNQEQVRLLAGLGVEGDAHAGTTVKHRSRVARNPDQPNLRQVHLIHSELYAELREAGFDVSHGQMGENITTGGVDLLGLPTGALLRIPGHRGGNHRPTESLCTTKQDSARVARFSIGP